MSEKKLRKKLTILKEKRKAYDAVLALLKTRMEDPEMPAIYRDVCYSVWRMVNNVTRMVNFGILGVELDLKKVR